MRERPSSRVYDMGACVFVLLFLRIYMYAYTVDVGIYGARRVETLRYRGALRKLS